jgi:hypothetical protein
LKPPGISDHSFNLSFSEQSKTSSYLSVPYRDRRTYKNLSIYITELPPTPKVFRDKYHRTREPGAGCIRRKPQYPAAVCNQGRPQTNQMGYVSQCLVPDRPHTLGYIDIQGAAPNKGRRKEDTSEPVLWSRDFSASDKSAQQRLADIDQCEIALEEMAATKLDKDYMDELAAIERWFRVLSNTERTASLYSFVQQITQGHIRFLLQVLQQMAESHPMCP